MAEVQVMDAPTPDQGLRVDMWCRLYLIKPPKTGYYRVRDEMCREGIAFMHPNHEWTNIEGKAEKPFIDWMDIA